MIKKKYNKNAFLKLEAQIRYSLAFNNLKGKSLIILLEVLADRRWERTTPRSKKFVRTDNNRFHIPYRKFNEPPFNLHNPIISSSLAELLAVGFLTIIEQGGSRQGHATIFALSEDFRGWKKQQEPFETRKSFSHRGFTSKKDDS